ncbi:tudor domain-containing protein 1-like [Aricia agestis]|uniref:tudor domain-containing protein 1-like n=1 Tax=Aricia agestis TaxID=91739 RepID=UPI001C20B3E8|nr:tudor domain-containing protein 1-like [Aricia agestis]
MSFVDLATLALHRRHEIEARIQTFLEKCDTAIQDIEKLKSQASGFVDRLNCEPSELKDRFLSSMRQLDEYTYLLTDFNLAVGKLDLPSNMQYTPPVQDSFVNILKPIQAPVPNGKYNLMDALSEPAPSTSTACANSCPPEKDKPRKIPREEQLLIAFSSNSCSSESVPFPYNETKELLQCQIDGIKKLTLDDSAYSDELNLPAQSVLEVDQTYSVIITHADGPMLWVIIDSCGLYEFLKEMTEFYKENTIQMKMEDVINLTYCACYDEDTKLYYRGLMIKLSEDGSTGEVFLMDTGEVRSPRVRDIQPLHARFRRTPPHARCCHLAGIDTSYESESAEKIANIIKEYVHCQCTITIDDNSSESLGVYVRLSTGECLNDLVTQEERDHKSPPRIRVKAELDDRNFDITACPEYEDPVEAVTGYRNRDEMDICMHYKGGPEKTCFKGTRCKKRHVLMHPDGWTLDRVSVPVHVPTPLLPAPGCWVRVLVTHVAFYNTLYVQMQEDQPELTPPRFGEVLPPATLEQLVQDMNSPASRTAMKPLTLAPAPGELVAALYPPDEQWYRARVISPSPGDQNIEVLYIDYGNRVWVRWECVRALAPRWCSLAAQAVCCTLAGVTVEPPSPDATAAARDALDHLAKEKRLDARVVARDFDELTVELYDESGFSIAEQLLTNPHVKPKPYSILPENYETQKIIVP